MQYRARQNRWVMVKTSDKKWPTGEGNQNQFSILALRTLGSMKRQKDMTLKDELPRSVDVQYATGQEGRNSSRKNKDTEPRCKHW